MITIKIQGNTYQFDRLDSYPDYTNFYQELSLIFNEYSGYHVKRAANLTYWLIPTNDLDYNDYINKLYIGCMYDLGYSQNKVAGCMVESNAVRKPLRQFTRCHTGLGIVQSDIQSGYLNMVNKWTAQTLTVLLDDRVYD